jgi:hypothetical protein
LNSAFTAVHQPVAPGGNALRIEALAVRSNAPLARAVAVHGDGFTDYHLTGVDDTSEIFLTEPPVAAVGRYAFVRFAGGAPVAMGLLDGTRIEAGGRCAEVVPGATGTVLAIRNAEAGDAEHALVVDAAVPPRTGRDGEHVVVRLANGMTYGLAVREIRHEETRTIIGLTHRPGLRLTDDSRVAMTHWPRRQADAPLGFHLPAHAWWQAE